MWPWARLCSSTRWKMRHLCTTIRHYVKDEGDWSYSNEWWGTDSNGGHSILRSLSDQGNGVVSVVAHPSSRPNECYWPERESWLQRRYNEIYPNCKHKEQFRILGYQWRVLHFNEVTRQSAVKVMAAYRESEPGSVYLMQQANVLAVPYLKSMVSTGLAAIASCNFDILNTVHGKDNMNVLCIGHGGGSLPLFLASKLQGANVDIVEIDPVVISASVQALGFPPFSVMNPSGGRALKVDSISEVLWKGIHERLFLYESDAEQFVLNTNNVYDLIFIDAYDGDDIFHRKLWDPHGPFMKALSNCLHPEHGTVVVNLHSDADILNSDDSLPSDDYILPMGKYVKEVCQAYKNVLVGNGSSHGGREGCGLGFNVQVPWVCNSTMVVCRGFRRDCVSLSRDLVVNTLISKSLEVENALKLPFSCMEYIKRGFVLVD